MSLSQGPRSEARSFAAAGGLEDRPVLHPRDESASAFDEIYRAYRQGVEAVCRRYLSDARDVEEAVQDTFLKAFVALPGFGEPFRTGAWLIRIAKNTSIDMARRNNRRRDEIGTNPASLEDFTPGVDDLYVRFSSSFLEALELIPLQHARVLRLRIFEGATHAEIGAILGKSTSQIKSLLHRARRSVKDALRELDT